MGLWDWVVWNEGLKTENKLTTDVIKMKSYCLKCKKKKKYWKHRSKSFCSSNGRTMILSSCAICGGKKSRFIENQEAKGLLSKLGIRTLLSKVPIIGHILF